jgi:L-ascorbate metabolism protein UlaG (beta-lactamase superfamily)
LEITGAPVFLAISAASPRWSPWPPVRAASFLKAKVYIPMHYETFEVIKADPAEFVRKAKEKGYNAVVVKPGAPARWNRPRHLSASSLDRIAISRYKVGHLWRTN